jgi:anhydro-N-acetylmuramic acid kinase
VTTRDPDYYLGCISGTSVDGLDVALVSITASGEIAIVAAETAPLPEVLRDQLLELGRPGDDDLDALGWADTDLGEFIGETLITFINAQNLTAGDIKAIGSHGQTVRHRPPTERRPHGFSSQIGDPNRIAEITGITTIADFRRRDMAAGGHGAPLVPPFHQELFGNTTGHTAILNIGGISNISLLGAQTSGFDTGPGNALMDSWCYQHRNQAYDDNGAWAAIGQVDDTLLASFLSDPYFDLPPPKSTGREYFNLDWLSQQLQVSNASSADTQATLCSLTARCTTDALAKWAPATDKIVVCGGGRLNAELMRRLQANTAAHVCTSEVLGVDGDSIEAALFGWLAYRRLASLAGNEPAVTGAAGYRVLGAIYQA